MAKIVIYSEYDNKGKLQVDCTECDRGNNGDKSCSSGLRCKKPRQGACFSGNVLPKVEEHMKVEGVWQE